VGIYFETCKVTKISFLLMGTWSHNCSNFECWTWTYALCFFYLMCNLGQDLYIHFYLFPHQGYYGQVCLGPFECKTNLLICNSILKKLGWITCSNLFPPLNFVILCSKDGYITKRFDFFSFDNDQKNIQIPYVILI
jgi:hypothetical protein